ncbi:sugar O-acetyltransferase [Methanimicrococcus blatticola]|uniref:Acetyltransferase-like isoleucine patch superfamily enzyme n=1 Tax=Methanimicrococcus blatticola TaxID=91560 RepID=A0A484F7E6_9EURY|nr:sugar O-acetyltransferase [Methanimicrococcus blatticola]MBZ3935208.1 sugar O-acetyltransferase [Methanimicrococcus blatticola]MCC2508695.1 sugar O-acetyltransferase [Methanimicrococcus blatticola]TDQ71268.1 acetyltransferase-like isoleucine patch superfamily enzyme [Methanimicrococcus blatticola]
MSSKDILERDRTGEIISINDPEYPKISVLIEEAQRITAEMNTVYHEPEEIRVLFSELTGKKVDDSFGILMPFYTDFGKNISIGKNVFVNHACTFMDRGGITIEDNVLIGPKVNLLTINHPIDPATRRCTVSKPIKICKNVWLGAAATVLAGITIGENSIVSAGAVVTKDVPANVIVAGCPAKIIKEIE